MSDVEDPAPETPAVNKNKKNRREKGVLVPFLVGTKVLLTRWCMHRLG